MLEEPLIQTKRFFFVIFTIRGGFSFVYPTKILQMSEKRPHSGNETLMCFLWTYRLKKKKNLKLSLSISSPPPQHGDNLSTSESRHA